MMGTRADLPVRHRLVLVAARIVLTLRHPALVARFAMRLGYLPNPAAPSRYNELMLWRKIVDRNPLFVTLTDKLAAKAYIRAACPELPIPETLWCGRRPEDLPADLLSDGVVVKPNHGCAMDIFVSEGRPERAAIVRKARRWLGKPYGRRNGEWAYWPIDRALFIEERLDLAGGSIATDIKVHVCNGIISHVWAGDKLAERSHLFDDEGKPLPGRDPDYPREDQALPLTPRLLDFVRQAIALAPRIAGDLDHVRVDFLVTDKGLHAGEICIYTAAGYGTWTNPEIARRMERYWRLEHSALSQATTTRDRTPLRRGATRPMRRAPQDGIRGLSRAGIDGQMKIKRAAYEPFPWERHSPVMGAAKALLNPTGRQDGDPNNQWKEMLK